MSPVQSEYRPRPATITGAAILNDGGHGELAGAVEPDWVIRASVKLEECISVSACAVAKVRALCQRTCGPGKAPAIKQQRVEFRRRERRIGARSSPSPAHRDNAGR